MLVSTLFLLGIGFLAAVFLAIASRVFYVYEDPKIMQVEDVLLGANCGGCGYPGCSAAAEAVVKGEAGPEVCVAGGADIALNVAGIMGMEIELKEPEISCSSCKYGTDEADTKFYYEGVKDCRAANLFDGGPKECSIGCIGFGTCAKSCPFGAITMDKDNLPVFDMKKCTGCGICVEVCPKNIIRLTSETLRILHLYRVDECTSPCQRACPAGIDIREYISKISEKDYAGALKIIKERNPFPLSCGRVCPHPCEDVCRQTIVCDAVNINHMKRFVADIELKKMTRERPFIAAATEKKVAIIGGGPAGLSAAYYLARLGHSPTIFEGMPKLGGMLRYGIPEYRLPKETLDFEIDGILELGVEVKNNIWFGKDITIDSLKNDGYESIYIGTGAWDSRGMGVDGEDLEGVISGVDFLKERGLENETPVGKKVAVIGGGNTAIDAARTCWRLGAEEVILIYRRSKKEMPANEIEIEEAENEGIQFHFLAAPSKLIGENGKLTHIEYIEMELGEPDESGRRRPVPKKGSEKKLQVDNVISAIGQFPVTSFLGDFSMTKWNTIEVKNEFTFETNIPGVFAGGDVVSGADIAIGAIGAGRRAARSIHLFFRGEEIAPPENVVTATCDLPVVEKLESVACTERVKMPEMNVEERRMSFEEVELGLTEEMALRESDRCLKCGLICYRKN